MSANHRAELTRVPIHASLVRPFMMMGGERVLVICSAMISGYMGYLLTMRFGIYWGAPIGGALWSAALFILRRLAIADPLMSKVWGRSRRYRTYYPARGRFNAFQPNYKDFK